jgi:molybdenum cofactor guanylyltransferase
MNGTRKRLLVMGAKLTRKIPFVTITGLVLAGGQGRRMGGVDKGLQTLRGKPMAQWALERLAPQVGEVLINCNQNLEAYARFGYRLVPDEIGGFAGPLAGLHAGLRAAAHPLVATVPCDSPFLPRDLVARLQTELRSNDLAVAKTGSQAHPVFSLVRKDVLQNLQAFLESGGRKIDAWYASLRTIEVSFDDEADAFRNINTLEELGKA